MGAELSVVDVFVHNYKNVRRTAYIKELKEETGGESGPIYDYIKTKATADYYCGRVNHTFFNKEDALNTCVKWRVKEDIALHENRIFVSELAQNTDRRYRDELRQKYN